MMVTLQKHVSLRAGDACRCCSTFLGSIRVVCDGVLICGSTSTGTGLNNVKVTRNNSSSQTCNNRREELCRGYAVLQFSISEIIT